MKRRWNIICNRDYHLRNFLSGHFFNNSSLLVSHIIRNGCLFHKISWRIFCTHERNRLYFIMEEQLLIKKEWPMGISKSLDASAHSYQIFFRGELSRRKKGLYMLIWALSILTWYVLILVRPLQIPIAIGTITYYGCQGHQKMRRSIRSGDLLTSGNHLY